MTKYRCLYNKGSWNFLKLYKLYESVYEDLESWEIHIIDESGTKNVYPKDWFNEEGVYCWICFKDDVALIKSNTRCLDCDRRIYLQGTIIAQKVRSVLIKNGIAKLHQKKYGYSNLPVEEY